MSKISKPLSAKHWLVTDGKTLHTGCTEPGQVTSSGLGKIVSFDTIEELDAAVEKHKALLPSKEAESMTEGEYYNDKGSLYRHEDKK